MIIQYLRVEPAQDYLKPSLRFTLSVEFGQGQEAVTDISGLALLDDKIIGNLELESQQMEFNLQAIRFIGEPVQKVKKEAMLILSLDQLALDRIEKSRKSNKKGDVLMTLRIRVSIIRNLAGMSYVVEYPLNKAPFPEQSKDDISEALGVGKGNVSLLFYADQYDKYSQNRTNLVLLSSNGVQGGPGIGYINIEHFSLNLECKIPSADWIHDLSPLLGLGEYFVVEVPSGDKIVKGAWELVRKAEESYRQWGSPGVAGNCRLVGQSLDAEIKNKYGDSSFVYNERWGRIYKGFDYWVSMPLHLEGIKNEGTGGRSYKKEEVKAGETDAEIMLVVTKSLIKYAEGLITEID
ncbi:MAG: hypothetical protein M0Z77_11230 [Thermoplasmatales archaeon]|nr:hypothetical protein [Thermoplasmatales archaeon]